MDISVNATGVVLPATVYGSPQAQERAILSHGLGSRDPSRRTHLREEWVALLLRELLGFGASCIAYTARGHGSSTGWERSAGTDPHQFTWQGALSDDLLLVAKHHNESAGEGKKSIFCGNSMGSATSLYAAHKDPESCRALILIRLPTAWDERRARRKNLLGAARRLAAEKGGGQHHLVLEGAALSDLPPVDELPVYCSKMKGIPLLMLCVEGDDSHPPSTATVLQQYFEDAKLFISANEEQARNEFPEQIKIFLASLSNSEGK